MRRLFLIVGLLAIQYSPPCTTVKLWGHDSAETRIWLYQTMPDVCFEFPWDPSNDQTKLPPWPNGVQYYSGWVGPALYEELPATPQSPLWETLPREDDSYPEGMGTI